MLPLILTLSLQPLESMTLMLAFLHLPSPLIIPSSCTALEPSLHTPLLLPLACSLALVILSRQTTYYVSGFIMSWLVKLL